MYLRPRLISSALLFVSTVSFIFVKLPSHSNYGGMSHQSLSMAPTSHREHMRHSPPTTQSNSMSTSSLTLPSLSSKDCQALENGERIQKQDRYLNAGRGLVVMDVKASREDIFELLCTFDKYSEFIPTVRGVSVYKQTDLKTSVKYILNHYLIQT